MLADALLVSLAAATLVLLVVLALDDSGVRLPWLCRLAGHSFHPGDWLVFSVKAQADSEPAPRIQCRRCLKTFEPADADPR